MDHKEILHQGLRRQRDALFAKLDGLPEREVRLPRTPTGTNLLGLLKHAATCELEYFGEVFGRPAGIPLPWDAPGVGEEDGAPVARYAVEGELFFASSNDLYTQFGYARDPQHVRIDLSRAHIWDASTVAALDSIREKYDRHGVQVEIVGLDRLSSGLHDRLTRRPRG